MDIEWLHKLEVVVMLSVSTPLIKGFLILKNKLKKKKKKHLFCTEKRDNVKERKRTTLLHE